MDFRKNCYQSPLLTSEPRSLASHHPLFFLSQKLSHIDVEPAASLGSLASGRARGGMTERRRRGAQGCVCVLRVVQIGLQRETKGEMMTHYFHNQLQVGNFFRVTLSAARESRREGDMNLVLEEKRLLV